MRKGTLRSFGKEVMKGSSPRVPQQDNFSDCGVYILQYVESFFEVRRGASFTSALPLRLRFNFALHFVHSLPGCAISYCACCSIVYAPHTSKYPSIITQCVIMSLVEECFLQHRLYHTQRTPLCHPYRFWIHSPLTHRCKNFYVVIKNVHFPCHCFFFKFPPSLCFLILPASLPSASCLA